MTLLAKQKLLYLSIFISLSLSATTGEMMTNTMQKNDINSKAPTLNNPFNQTTGNSNGITSMHSDKPSRCNAPLSEPLLQYIASENELNTIKLVGIIQQDRFSSIWQHENELYLLHTGDYLGTQQWQITKISTQGITLKNCHKQQRVIDL